QKLLRLPFEHRVREALESLAEHDVFAAGRLQGTEMQIRKLAAAASVAPLGGQHHQIEGVRTLDLEPAPPPFAGRVARLRRLRHEPFRTGPGRGLEEAPRRWLAGGD